MAGLLDRLKSFGRSQVENTASSPEQLFSPVDPRIDGEECLHDCSTCVTHYPHKFKIDHEDELYGKINGWNTHMIVATGKTDWVRDVSDEVGSIMEAVRDSTEEASKGKMMLSASNMPLPDHDDGDVHQKEPVTTTTTILLLPAFTYFHNVTPQSIPYVLSTIVPSLPTTTSPLTSFRPMTEKLEYNLSSSPCRFSTLILLCSQATRDARCGQSAPLLKRELERHLRPLGLYRDVDDHRPGGVGILFISHVGGHKYSANVMIYRRNDNSNTIVNQDGENDGGASQCIWLARVKPEDCEGIVKYTVLQGKVVKPKTQLRGGFDRFKGLTSW